MLEQAASVLLVYIAPDNTSYTIKGKPDYSVARRPQLGLQYLVSTLEAAGHRADFMDQTAQGFSEEDLLAQIAAHPYLFVGFYTADALIHQLTTLLPRVKKALPSMPIVVGGPGTLAPDLYLDAGADLAVLGEGERTILELVEHYQGARPLDEIRGICRRRDGVTVYSKPQEAIHDLDVLPFPDRDKIPVGLYHDFYIYNMRLPYVTMIASRGCAYKCSFCTSHVIWNSKIRFRSPGNVVAEIDHLVAKYGVKYISFQDDIFGPSEKWIREFTALLIERRHDLNWMCILHPFTFRKNRTEILDLMRAAGCDTISMGLQSADPEVLKAIRRRPEEPDSAIETIREAKRRGILTAMGYIFGLPGDTEETIQRTMDYVMRCEPHHAEFYCLSLLKGSELEKRYGATGVPCAVGPDRLAELAKLATRRFYSNPRTLWRNASYVLFHQPRWLFFAMRHLPNMLKVTGLIGRNENEALRRLEPAPERVGVRSC